MLIFIIAASPQIIAGWRHFPRSNSSSAWLSGYIHPSPSGKCRMGHWFYLWHMPGFCYCICSEFLGISKKSVFPKSKHFWRIASYLTHDSISPQKLDDVFYTLQQPVVKRCRLLGNMGSNIFLSRSSSRLILGERKTGNFRNTFLKN